MKIRWSAHSSPPGTAVFVSRQPEPNLSAQLNICGHGAHWKQLKTSCSVASVTAQEHEEREWAEKNFPLKQGQLDFLPLQEQNEVAAIENPLSFLGALVMRSGGFQGSLWMQLPCLSSSASVAYALPGLSSHHPESHQTMATCQAKNCLGKRKQGGREGKLLEGKRWQWWRSAAAFTKYAYKCLSSTILKIKKSLLNKVGPYYMLMAAHLILSLVAFCVCCVKALTRAHTVTCQARTHGNSAMSYCYLHPEARQAWLPPLWLYLNKRASAMLGSSLCGTMKEQRRWSSSQGAGPTPWPLHQPGPGCCICAVARIKLWGVEGGVASSPCPSWCPGLPSVLSLGLEKEPILTLIQPLFSCRDRKSLVWAFFFLPS